MAKFNDYIVIFVTASSMKQAKLLSKHLIENKLAACVNTVPVNSVFTWQGKVDKAKEILLIIKSRQRLFRKVERLIKRYHSYEVPEIIGLPIIAGSKDYLDWIKTSTRS